MRLSFKRLTAVLNVVALSTACFVLTGCQTTEPEPVFEDYEPDVWIPPAQTTAPVQAQTQQEPDNIAAAEATNPTDLSAVFDVGNVVYVLVKGVTSEDIPPHQESIKDDGTINLYLVGKVKAIGRTAGELQSDLQTRYEVYFKTPVVTVQAADRFYYVGGEVKRPGAQQYLGKTTVTKAIQSAGDFTDFAKKTKIQVIRADDTSLIVNFKKLIGEPSLDPPIYPGDKIHVPRRILLRCGHVRREVVVTGAAFPKLCYGNLLHGSYVGMVGFLPCFMFFRVAIRATDRSGDTVLNRDFRQFRIRPFSVAGTACDNQDAQQE